MARLWFVTLNDGYSTSSAAVVAANTRDEAVETLQKKEEIDDEGDAIEIKPEHFRIEAGSVLMKDA